MLKYLSKFALRSLLKNRIITVFNIIGLTLALSALFFVYSYIKYELSFDKFHSNYKQIYNVYYDETDEGIRDQYIQTPYGLGTYLEEDYAEVETMSRTYSIEESLVKKIDGEEYKDDLLLTDPSFFSLFKIDFLSGFNPALLQSPNEVCISQQCAEKYFPNTNPLDQSLVINDMKYVVKAVFKDYPKNSHLKFDLLGSLATITQNRDIYDLDGYMYSTYVKLRTDVDSHKFEQDLMTFIHNRLAPFVEKNYQLDVEEWFSRGNSISLKLMPLSKIHLQASHIAGFDNQNNISNVILMFVVSILLLFIACFNFINFSNSIARKRTISIGIKKICGSNKTLISFQSFLEASMVYAISIVFAIIIYYAIRYGISDAFEYNIAFRDWSTNLTILLGGIGIAFICGFLPSYFHIRKIPHEILKNKIDRSGNRFSRSKVFVGMQFMVSIVISIFFIVIHQQVNLITSRDLGFEKDNVMIIHRTNRDRAKAVILADQLKNLPGIKAVSVSNSYPGGGLPTKDLQLKNSPNGFSYSPQYFCCDSDLIRVLNLKLVEGSFFSKNTPSNSILLNEEAIKIYGIEDNPIGKIFTRSSGEEYQVIGVVKNFNFRSLHRAVEPLCIYTGIDRSNSLGASTLLVKLEHMDNQVIEVVKKNWKEVYNEAYFDYSFLDDKINDLYKKELLLRKIVPIATLLAFLISIIGLIGITYLKMDEKRKEIGIRKVNGAKVSAILTLLNKDFVKWVVISFVIACPVAWYAMSRWLESFAYKTQISWWIFAMAGTVSLLIAVTTVSLQSFKAANRNPVEALRYE